MSIKVSIKGDKVLGEKLKKLSDKDLISAKKKCLQLVANLIVGEAKKQAPVMKGSLRKSITLMVYDNYATVFSQVPYAEYVHEGSKAHLIRLVKKKSLYRENNGVGVFSSIVHHPGNKANPFFERAVKNLKNGILDRCNEIFSGAIDKL